MSKNSSSFLPGIPVISNIPDRDRLIALNKFIKDMKQYGHEPERAKKFFEGALKAQERVIHPIPFIRLYFKRIVGGGMV